jgi:nitrogen regulatory protein P-II 1
MKMVVAYIDRDRFDPIRADLLEHGFLSLSVVEAQGSFPDAAVVGRYRGAELERHVRPKYRVEIVVGDEEATTVSDTVLKHAGDRVLVLVLGIEDAYPTATIKGAEAALQGG